MQSALIIHIPHASLHIPPFALEDYVKEKLYQEFLVMTDHYCSELFSSEISTLEFPYSRLYCDVERFKEDEKEEMSSVGMGFAYTHCSDGSILRKISEERKEQILISCYEPHHKQLNEMTEKALKENGSCLIIDGHSFYPEPLPYELHPELYRPEICIGTDPFHTPEWLSSFCLTFFNGKGYDTAFNAPFIGTIVPLPYYGKEPKVRSVMIEINRKLYMDKSGEKTASFEKVRTDIREFLETLSKEEKKDRAVD